MSAENIYKINGDDEDVKIAMINAVDTFKYLWRELSWEYRRIIPGLDLHGVKVGFDTGIRDGSAPKVEHMWISQIDFDGVNIFGKLLNKPKWTQGLGKDDNVTVKLEEIGDWMYSIGGRVYGAFTVNLMRKKMNKKELIEHDEAWGLDFGNDFLVELMPHQNTSKKQGLLSKIFGKKVEVTKNEIDDHPMSINMGPEIEKQVAQNPNLVRDQDGNGDTLLHKECLAGNYTPVNIMLKYGAEPHLKNSNGFTPLELAKKMKWESIVNLINEKNG